MDKKTLKLLAEKKAPNKKYFRDEDIENISPVETGKLIHNLRVHQIELELQNEELLKLQEELNEARMRYFSLYDLAPEGYLILSEKGIVVEANLTVAKMLGLSKSALIKKSLTKWISEEDQDIYYLKRRKLFETSITQSCELRMVKKNGSTFWARISASLAEENGSPLCRVIISDITVLKQAEETQRTNEKRLIAAQALAQVGNWELDLRTNLIWGSAEASKIYGIETDGSFLAFERVQKLVLPEYREKIKNAHMGLLSGKGDYDVQIKIRTEKLGEEKHIHSKAVAETDDRGKIVKLVGVVQDISKQKNLEESLVYLGYHDQLTDLYNRRFFEDHIKTFDTEENLPISIIMGDLNGLKIINDTFGHSMGDNLLRNAAEIIQSTCPSGSSIIRFGGDEFIAIIHNTDESETVEIISRIQKTASKTKLSGIELSISFGYAVKVHKSENLLAVLAIAENHMYKHKFNQRSSTHSKTIDIIMKTLFEKSNRESAHSMRVSRICEAIAQQMSFDQDDVDEMRTAGLVHDIGKISIEEGILNKRSPLTKDEWVTIKNHPESGWRILNASVDFSNIANHVRAHHERWDGKGYPFGLKGDQIPIEARIIAVADSFDAMTSDRPYKVKLSYEEAARELLRCSNSQFDSEVVIIFINQVLPQIL